jgi:hypothetical protein
MKYITPLVFLTMLFFSCGGKKEPKADYYFPVTKFNSINVYTFMNKNDTTDQSHWHMKAFYNGKDTVLKTTIVDANNRINEVFIEKISGGNSTLQSYFMYNYDSKGVSYNTSCEILENNMYRADQKVGESIKWKISFYDPNSQKCELTKTRTLKEVKENKKIFLDDFTLVITQKAFIGNYSMESVYQKNKGLISYKLMFPNGQVKEMVLTGTRVES